MVFQNYEMLFQVLQTKGFNISNDNIFVTVGSSGAFLLTFIVCFDPGDTVLLLNPVVSMHIEIFCIH